MGHIMPRIAFILFLVAGIFCSGCRTYSPETKTALQKYRMVKRGMTHSQVYAILPANDIFQGRGAATEEWQFGSVSTDAKGPQVMTTVFTDVTFGADGRVQKVGRDIAVFHLGLMTE
jgi:hypothetical protein